MLNNKDDILIQDSKDLISSLQNSNKELSISKNITSEELLRREISSFITTQLAVIQAQDNFRAIVVNALIEKIRLHDMDTNELLNLYRTISSEKAGNTQVVLDLFKPSANMPNSILNPKPPEEESNDLQTIIKSADSKQLQGLFLLFKKMETLLPLLKESKEKNKEENSEDND